MRNFIKMVNNPDIMNPTVYLVPEKIVFEGKCIIYIHVPPSSEVHRYKKVIYDRVDDADVRVTSTSQIAAMYIRKQNIFTEKKIYPYICEEHLRLDLLPLCRKRAINKRQRNLYKYSKRYSGKNPSIIEGDIFRIIVPLDDAYSFDANKVGDKVGDDNFYHLTENQHLIIDCLEKNPGMSATQLAKKIGISPRKVESNIQKLKEFGMLQRQGSPRKGHWVVRREV